MARVTALPHTGPAEFSQRPCIGEVLAVVTSNVEESPDATGEVLDDGGCFAVLRGIGQMSCAYMHMNDSLYIHMNGMSRCQPEE